MIEHIVLGVALFVVMVIGLTNLYLLRMLSKKQARLREQFALHHRIVATVGPLIGLARIIEDGGGDFSGEQRARIRAAFEEQVETFHRTLGVEPVRCTA